jgi:predicted dehydrogenase
MGDEPSRANVSVALVGVGPTWELHYRGAIQRLSSKLSVKVVCDSVEMRAAAVADEFDASAVSCPWLLTQRYDCHAWLILDPGWFDTYPADLSVRVGRPALYANTFASSIPRLIPILQRSVETGETLMPEFPQRCTPATTRLRELMATKLGPVRRIDVSIPLPATDSATVADWLQREQAEVIGLFDWCAWLIGGASPEVTFHAATAFHPTTADHVSTGDHAAAADADARFDLRFPMGPARPAGGGVTIRLHAGGGAIRRQIECERGSAVIDSPTQISWQAGVEHAGETLNHERSPQEIILDQFCRRALGGLVPVPTPTDALRAIATAQLALKLVRDSRQTPVEQARE